MRRSKLAGYLGGAALAVPIAPSALSAILTVDDFGGGPHLVNLTSLTPPQLATGTFLHAGAIGGVRDVFVLSQSVGIFSSGVSFGSGGYASFTGNGLGGVIWDGSSAGAVDGDSDGAITPNDFEYGLSFDATGGFPGSIIHLQAFADLPGAQVVLFFGNSPTDYGIYNVPLTTVGAFDDYFVPVGAPSATVGLYDPTDVKTVAMLIDGTAFDNLDVRANLLGIELIPEPGTWVAMSTLGGILGLALMRARRAAASA